MNGEDKKELIMSSKSNSSEIRSTTSTATNHQQQQEERPYCRSHKEAERRRRQRINSHLSTLRTLLPNTTKTDKASLLAEVVQHVTELKKQVADMANDTTTFPGESDEMSLVSYADGAGSRKMVRLTICCDDRPGLNQDLAQAIRSVQATAVRAEMVTVGGRTKSIVVMEWAGGCGGDEDVGVLRRALLEIAENRPGLGFVGRGGKRTRISGFLKNGVVINQA